MQKPCNANGRCRAFRIDKTMGASHHDHVFLRIVSVFRHTVAAAVAETLCVTFAIAGVASRTALTVAMAFAARTTLTLHISLRLFEQHTA